MVLDEAQERPCLRTMQQLQATLTMDNKHTTLGQRINAWVKRNSEGTLMFPLCVLAHYDEIAKIAPSAIKKEEYEYIKKRYGRIEI